MFCLINYEYEAMMDSTMNRSNVDYEERKKTLLFNRIALIHVKYRVSGELQSRERLSHTGFDKKNYE